MPYRIKKKYIEFESQKLDDKHLQNIKSDLLKDWTTLLSADNDVNQNFQLFHNELATVLDTYTETKKIKISNKKIIKEPWLTKGIITSSNKQLLLYKHWLQNKDAKSYDRYKQYWDTLPGWPRHRENREFGSYFFQTGKTQGILLQHRESF